jgi:uncharacterized cupin superfamily protein
MASRVVSADVLTAPLSQQSHPGQWIDGGWPTAASEQLAQVGDADITLWEITEGVVTDVESEECLLVVAGEGTLRFASGQEVDLRPGVLVELEAGEHTEWTVLSTLRALLVSRRSGSAEA